MFEPLLAKNDKRAYWIIGIFSLIVFGAIAALGKIEVDINPKFDIHIFARLNSFINSLVAILLIAALLSVKRKDYKMHRRLMFAALILSIFFLVFYIAHHLLAGEAKFGDLNKDGLLSEAEKLQAGSTRYIYYFILGTHILLAGIIMPFILFTTYRALTADWQAHKKLARYTWPLWLYVAITGPIVYLFISPYY
jgi:putative membrane protein